MKRLMIVYNPRSSKFGRVRDEVIDESRGLEGWVVGKYEVLDTDVDDNAARLAKVLNDEDLVVAAGGDATATIALNGAMLSKTKNVKLGVLGYGNFNDMARTLGARSLREIVAIAEGGGGGRVAEVWGLECLVNGKHWRWGMCYFTAGLFAESTVIFDRKDNRRGLRTGRTGMFYSIWLLAGWYFKHRKQKFLMDFALRGDGAEGRFEGATDYVAVNGASMAKIMRGGKWFLGDAEFLSGVRNLRGFWGLAWFMARSVLTRIPGKKTRGDVLAFDEPAKVMIQAEGEYKKLEGVKTIEVRKAEKPIKVVLRG